LPRAIPERPQETGIRPGAAAASPEPGASPTPQPIEPVRSAAELDRVLPLLRKEVGLPYRTRAITDRELLRKVLGPILAMSGGKERIAAAIAVEPHFGLFRDLATLLADSDSEAAAAAVRASLSAGDQRVRANAAASLDLLPRSEGEGLWHHLLTDADANVRQSVVCFPLAGAEFDAAAREAALHETDPAARGGALSLVFASRPTVENLSVVLAALEQDHTEAFRVALLETLPSHLTARDTAAVRLIRQIATDPAELPAVRDLARKGLLDGGPGIAGLIDPSDPLRR
jgi:hypothetical protein